MSSKFVLQQEDGTVAGGNARGAYAADLQMSRTANTQVASGDYSFIGGFRNTASGNLGSIALGYNNNAGDGTAIGRGNTASSYNSTAIGYNNTATGSNSTAFGYNNSATGGSSSVGGGYNNTASRDYSTISGGQSNTASTGSQATVVGGYQNTSSGQYSVSGGWVNVASGSASVSLGRNCNSTGAYSVALGGYCRAYGEYSACIGGSFGTGSLAGGKYSVALGSYTRSYLYGQLSYTGNSFDKSYSTGAIYGQSQISFLNPSKIDTLTTGATTVLSLDGTGTTNLIIPDGNNRAWNVTVKWVAVCTATGSGTTAVGDVAIATDSFMFKKVSGTSSIGSVQNLQNSQDATMAGATCSYAVGGSQDLQITFTAPASANATTFRVVAKVELTEVAW